MPENWKKRYSELTEFIAGHPEIGIGKDIVKIPGDVRSEFYHFFDAIRAIFIREKSPDLLVHSSELIKNYKQIRKELIKFLELKNISIPPHINKFLRRPAEELTRGLFYSLFDLLQGKISLTDFEEVATQDIKSSFNTLNQLVYTKWITLTIMNLLNADKLFQVNIQKFPSFFLWKIGKIATEKVPIPQESRSLRFNEYSPENMFIVPDAIFHSALLNRYISFRSEIGRSLVVATDISKRREWYPANRLAVPTSGLILIYLADRPEEISLVADAKRICRPDLIIESVGQKDWYQEQEWQKLIYHHDSLKPKLGTYIVTQESLSKDFDNELQYNINILNVGFKQSMLETITNALSKQG